MWHQQVFLKYLKMCENVWVYYIYPKQYLSFPSSNLYLQHFDKFIFHTEAILDGLPVIENVKNSHSFRWWKPSCSHLYVFCYSMSLLSLSIINTASLCLMFDLTFFQLISLSCGRDHFAYVLLVCIGGSYTWITFGLNCLFIINDTDEPSGDGTVP